LPLERMTEDRRIGEGLIRPVFRKADSLNDGPWISKGRDFTMKIQPEPAAPEWNSLIVYLGAQISPNMICCHSQTSPPKALSQSVKLLY